MKGAKGGGIHFPLGARRKTAVRALRLPRTSKSSRDPGLLDLPLERLPGVGRRTAGKLEALGIVSIGDLLLHVPFRHEPPSRLTSISAIRPGEEVILRAVVRSCGVRPTRRRGLKVLEAVIEDNSGGITAVWYNQDYLETAFRRHPEVLVRGVLIHRTGYHAFIVKRHEILAEGAGGLHTLGMVPVYPATGDLSVRTIRSLLKKAVPYAAHLLDPLPAHVLASRHYPRKAEALVAFHFPTGSLEAARARERLAFEELLLLQLALLRRRRQETAGQTTTAFGPPGELTARFLQALPYTPTTAQRRVLDEIDRDLTCDRPMRRLLQGDVGSGKTVVATYCLVRAVEQGGQGALMVPTEVLADQHTLRLSEQFEPLGLSVGLLKGSQAQGERRETLAALASGHLLLVVGTHALIQEGVSFRDLRLVVVDEQHRFGVQQRQALASEFPQGRAPHVLHMTATPIPRSLSLTLYGDLDLSVIDELPAGRRRVRTRIVFPEHRERMWGLVRRELDRGYQAYVVCPLIEESCTLEETSAKQVFTQLAGEELWSYRVGLLHGQLPATEKKAVMQKFSAGEIDVLVTTTVIEVGVDVANATIMVVQGARRFGLSQLHQLRGRVGRGPRQAYCLLVVDEPEAEALERLALFSRTSDGFELAEADLRARGEGELFGDRQAGMSDLRIARLTRDALLLEQARRAAMDIMDVDPDLSGPQHRLLGDAVEAVFGRRAHLLDRV